MAALSFSEFTLAGKNAEYAQAVERLHERFGFDFVSIGLAAFQGAPLKWIYSAGATGERHKRIALAPGHGIGGIVLKAGKPMMLLDIDRDLDPRQYSSYPIVFAEDLRSFCALPLTSESNVVGALLCAFRSVRRDARSVFSLMIDQVSAGVCELGVISSGFMSMEMIKADDLGYGGIESPAGHSDLSNVIAAQEEERKRISRELHDGIAQELLTVSFLERRARGFAHGPEADAVFDSMESRIEAIIEELRTMSVTLRPSALDHLGLLAALRTHADMLERTYGAVVVVDGTIHGKRYDPAYETQVYRICQEAILNACKYSGSERVYVLIEDEEDAIAVTVRDEGVGFDADNPEIKGTGCGLPGMKERASLIGAQLSVESGSGGTVVSLRVTMPMVETADKDTAKGEGAGALDAGEAAKGDGAR